MEVGLSRVNYGRAVEVVEAVTMPSVMTRGVDPCIRCNCRGNQVPLRQLVFILPVLLILVSVYEVNVFFSSRSAWEGGKRSGCLVIGLRKSVCSLLRSKLP